MIPEILITFLLLRLDDVRQLQIRTIFIDSNPLKLHRVRDAIPYSQSPPTKLVHCTSTTHHVENDFKENVNVTIFNFFKNLFGSFFLKVLYCTGDLYAKRVSNVEAYEHAKKYCKGM